MNQIHKRYIIVKKCELCGMIHNGTEFILEDGKVIEKNIIRGNCDCDLEKTIAKIKGKCFICGHKFHTDFWTPKRKLNHFLANGNACSHCSQRAGLRSLTITRKNKYETKI